MVTFSGRSARQKIANQRSALGNAYAPHLVGQILKHVPQFFMVYNKDKDIHHAPKSKVTKTTIRSSVGMILLKRLSGSFSLQTVTSIRVSETQA